MMLVPEKLRAAAMELLARLRVGLDIPSRAEVLDLAARIEAISGQMSRLEASRAADSKLVDQLRQSAQGPSRASEAASDTEQKPRADRKPRSARTASGKGAAAKSGGASKKKPPEGTAGSKRKARSRNGVTKEADK